MPLSYHLIDGYNLLHAAGLARAHYGPGDLERARYGLLVRVADGLDDSERTRTVVVFDAADPPPDAERRFRFREITVEFAPDDGDADAQIEELIRRHSSPRQLRVVSDDLRVQRAAKRRGAQAVKSEAFLNRLERRSQPRRESIHRPPPEADATSDFSDDWADFFGLTEAELTAPPEAIAPIQPESTIPKPPQTAAATHDHPKKSPQSANPARSSPASPDESPAEPQPVEDAAYWQARIDDLLRETPPEKR